MTHSAYLQAIGIYDWEQRNKPSVTPPIQETLSEWENLQRQIATCTQCELHKSRTQTVFGVGNPRAQLMFIGEAPGQNEDEQGVPFVGRAGQLLTAMIKAIDFAREDVFIANILKCRPPNNRDPLPEEVSTCTPYLARQIAIIQPRILVALGRVAAHHLLQTKQSLESMRNKIHYYGVNKTPLIVTFHPAYLLRSPTEKKKSYQDLLFIQRTLLTLSDHDIAGRLLMS